MLNNKSHSKKDSNELIEMIIDIKNGNEELRNKIIKKYTPFIINTTSKITNSYIDVNNSEELSIAFEAFNTAINKYDEQKGSFIKFSELVIRSKILDYLRKESKTDKTYYITDDYMYIKDHYDFVHNMSLKDEIIEFKRKLDDYGVSLIEIIEKTPKHKDTREKIIMLAKNIVNNSSLLNRFYNSKKLPRNAIIKQYNVSTKFIYLNRKYLIACILILDSNWEGIKEYLSNKGVDKIDT